MKNNYKFQYNAPQIDPNAVIALYNDCGWNKNGFRNYHRTAEALQNSLGYCAVYENKRNEMVGFVRLVGDGIYVIQLVDLMVHSSHRGLGLAGKIVREIIARYSDLNPDASFMLVDGSDIDGFYTSMGFSLGESQNVYYLDTGA